MASRRWSRWRRRCGPASPARRRVGCRRPVRSSREVADEPAVIVTGYPREVASGWLEPLVTHPAAADVAGHVEPVAAAVAAAGLRRQLARLESSRRVDAEHQRLGDVEVEAAAEDAR